jgi:hypothetical protein
MKLVSVLALMALTAAAQPPPSDHPSQVAEPVTSVDLTKSGGVVARRTSAERTSGALAQAARAKNPLQLINPRAPKTYGDGWDNVSVDLITGQAQGIKLFTFGF